MDNKPEINIDVIKIEINIMLWKDKYINVLKISK